MDKKVMIIAIIVVVVVAVFGVAYMVGNIHEDGHNVTYHGNGGTTLSDKQDSMKSSSATALEDKYFAKDGYTQYNWNTKADGTGTTVVGGNKVPSDVSDLYAIWFPNLVYKGTAPESILPSSINYQVTVGGEANGTSYTQTVGTNTSYDSDSVVAKDTKVCITFTDATYAKISGDYAVFTTPTYTVYAKFTFIGATQGTIETVGTTSARVSVTANDTCSFQVEICAKILNVTANAMDGFNYAVYALKDGTYTKIMDVDNYNSVAVDSSAGELYFRVSFDNADWSVTNQWTKNDHFTVKDENGNITAINFSVSSVNASAYNYSPTSGQKYYEFTLYLSDGIQSSLTFTFSK